MMSFSCSVTCTVLGEVVLSNGLVPLRVCFRRLFMHCLVMAVNGQCLGILQAASCFGCATDSMFDMQARWTKVCRAAVSHEQTTLLQGIRRLCRYLLASITALWELYFCLSIRILSPFTHISLCFLEMYTWVYCYGFIVLFFCLHILQELHRTYSQVQSECVQLWLALKEDEILQRVL